MKRTRTFLFATLLALTPSAHAAIQEATPQAALSATQPLPEARRLLDRFVEVTKTRALVEKTTSMHVKGTFSLAGGQMEGPIEIWFKKPNQQRSKLELGMMGTILQGCNGKVAWMTNPMMGGRLMNGIELLQAVQEARWDSRLRGPAMYESTRTVGRESFDGKDCYKLELVIKPLEGMDPEETLEGRTTHEYYDVATGLLAGLEVYQESDMFAGSVRTTFKDYKDFGGYPMASRTVVEAGPQVVTITAEAVEFDTVGDEVFALPADIQVLLEDQKAADR